LKGFLSEVNRFHLDKTVLACITVRARTLNSAGHVCKNEEGEIGWKKANVRREEKRREEMSKGEQRKRKGRGEERRKEKVKGKGTGEKRREENR
jgi:hypothetical protein